MKTNHDYIKRTIAGETLLVPTGKTAADFSGMITLNPVAEFIWEHIENVDSFDAMVDAITEEFDVEADTAREDAYQFIMHLLRCKMVTTELEDHTW